MASKTDKLKGKTIVISGTFELHSRDDYKAMILRNGGKNSGSVSKKHRLYSRWREYGAGQAGDSTETGIKIINEKTFLEMLQTTVAQ